MFTVTIAEELAAIVPTAIGKPGAVTAPTFRLVTVTLVAAVPPLLVIVNCTTTFPEPSRLNTRVTLMLGPEAGGAGSTSMVVGPGALLYLVVSVGVNVAANTGPF